MRKNKPDEFLLDMKDEDLREAIARHPCMTARDRFEFRMRFMVETILAEEKDQTSQSSQHEHR